MDRSDVTHLGRLKEEEDHALRDTVEQIEQWGTYEKDYTALQERLSTLPNKVTHRIMVPFGKLAFMPGQLIHTNEILVLLGDNWFAERSAKQACDMIDRRKKYIKSMVDDLKKQQYLLESRLGFVSDMKETAEGKGDVVEIREEYDEQKEAKWKDERRRKREAALSKASISSLTSSSRHTSSQGHGREEEDGLETNDLTEEELLWDRLDELERQEEELDELALLDEDFDEEVVQSESISEMGLRDTKTASPASDKPARNERHVHWGDEQKVAASDVALNLHKDEEGKDVDDEEYEDECDEDGEGSQSSSVIRFSHTKVPDEDRPPKGDGKDLSPRSPADIYEFYQSKNRDGRNQQAMDGQPKSKLRNSASKPQNSSVPVPEKDVKPQPLPAPLSAFTGNVVEHSLSAVPKTTTAVSEEQSRGSKRVSRFRAGRQGKR